jgi:hypothetical protein
MFKAQDAVNTIYRNSSLTVWGGIIATFDVAMKRPVSGHDKLGIKVAQKISSTDVALVLLSYKEIQSQQPGRESDARANDW